MSLDQPLSPGDGGETTSFLQNQATPNETALDEQLIHKEQLNQLHVGLDEIRDELSEREVFLLENRLLSDEPLTLQEIGDHYGITREAVRQMESRLLLKIKASIIKPSHEGS